MMQPEQFDAFIAALRSGEYEQGRDQLMTPHEYGESDKDAYCCLGLYCHINGLDLRAEDSYYEMENFTLSGVNEAPEVLIKAMSRDQRMELARRNDDGDTFETIANYLVEHRSEFVEASA